MNKNITYLLTLSFFMFIAVNLAFGIEVQTPKMNPPIALPEYPIIDGSTSTIVMHAAIKAYLTDVYVTETHSKTYAALERLVPGSKNPADVLLSVKYYDNELETVEKRGADLVITPVAKEGFVFIVHKDNPVESLTQKQLRDIYSGKITNWKEVGGNDEKITGYQRNTDSGSQTAMVDFMGDVPLIEVPIPSLMISEMGTMLRDINAERTAIGYNIYSWSVKEALKIAAGEKLESLLTEDRVNTFMDIKFLAVDGVAPSDETLSDGNYPLAIYTYSYYNKGNEKGKKLTDWLLTAEGQKVIASGGYVGIFGELPPEQIADFDQDNTGIKKIIEKFYQDKKFKIHVSDRLRDEALIKAFSDGKDKDVTILYTIQNFEELTNQRNFTISTYFDGRRHIFKETRFIILTRAKGGAFEVITEGTAETFEKDNVKDKAMTDWLLTAEGENIIPSVKYAGIIGKLSISEKIDFHKYDNDAKSLIEKFYQEKELKIDIMGRERNEETVKEFAGEKIKDSAGLYIINAAGGNPYNWRFIVLTKKDGVFEVINEGGEVTAVYENGDLTLKKK